VERLYQVAEVDKKEKRGENDKKRGRKFTGVEKNVERLKKRKNEGKKNYRGFERCGVVLKAVLAGMLCVRVCVWGGMCVCMCVCVHTHTHTHAYMYVCMYVCMYIHIVSYVSYVS
jgi:hypothetical protein